jgi:FKBP-type peptidyl-prolyl cis-trans isomerase
MVSGFSDSMLDLTQDEMTILQTYGPKLNDILVARANAAVGNNKKIGADYLTKYLSINEKAIKTSSGLVYHETLAGTGTKASPSSTVLVHYHGTLSDGYLTFVGVPAYTTFSSVPVS